MILKTLASNKLLKTWLIMFLSISAAITTLLIYNSFSPWPLPSYPNWAITAPYGALSLLLVWHLRHNLFAAIGAIILFVGWLFNIRLFYPADGGDPVGYELIGGMLLYAAEAVALLGLWRVAKCLEKDTKVIIKLIYGTIAMLLFGAIIVIGYSPGKLTLIASPESPQYFWWFLVWNLVFITRAALGWENEPKTRPRVDGHQEYQIQEKEAA